MIKKYDGNDTKQLSPHFNVREFCCKCGKEHEFQINDELIEKLEKLYAALNCSKIIVTNAALLKRVFIETEGISIEYAAISECLDPALLSEGQEKGQEKRTAKQ